MTLISINHIDPAFANRPRTAYIASEDIFEVSDNYDREGRLLSSSAKVTMKSGKTYIVNETVVELTARIAQESPAPSNIAGPQGQQGQQGPPGSSLIPVSGTVYAPTYQYEQELLHVVYLTSGTISNTSSAYMRVTKVISQNSQDNLQNVTGTVFLANSQNNAIALTMDLSTNPLILNNGVQEIEGPTTKFYGDNQILNATASIPADGWYKLYLTTIASVGAPPPGNINYTNGSVATVLGMTLHYL